MAKIMQTMRNNWSAVMIGTICVLMVSQSVRGDYYFPGSSDSYAVFRKWHACMDSTFSFEFKTTSDSGLLMYADDGGRYDFFEVRLVGGSVSLVLNIVDGRDGNMHLESGIELDDDKWHKVEIMRNRMESSLAVDGERNGKVSFGSDFNFGDIRNNSPVYFGGLPSSFRGYGLHKLALPSAFYEKKFTGYVRNILMSNCTCEIVRIGGMINGEAVTNDPPESCEVRNNCGEGCVCVSQDDGKSTCDCSAANCDTEPTVHYHLPFDLVNGRTLVNPSGLDAEIQGTPVLVPGVAGNAVELDGRNNFVRLVGPGHRYECFGDLQLCDNGYTMGLWINITDPGFNDIVYLSNGGHTSKSHGVAMLYRNGHLEMRFRRQDGKEWRTKTDDILPHHWYHVAATWSTDNGLKLFINGNQVDHDPNPTIRDPKAVTDDYNEFLLGRPNDGTPPSQKGSIAMDEFHFWSEEKTPQQIRNAGPFYKFFLPMNWISSSGILLRSAAMVAEAKGGAKLVNAKIGTGVQFNGLNQYVEGGAYNDVCLGDIGQCWYGLTMGAWINVPKMQNGAYLIYTGPNGLSLYMEDNALFGRFVWNNKQWKVVFPDFKPGKWYFVELTWNKEGGAKMYIDLKEVSSQGQSTSIGAPPRDNNFYLGRSPDSPVTFAEATMDDIELWYGQRDTLVRTKFILRGQIDYVKIPFEEWEPGMLEHSTLDIKLHGDPTRWPGKIGDSAYMNGNNQWIDLGDNGKSCLGNVELCPYGQTLLFWLNPKDLQRESFIISAKDYDVFTKNGRVYARYIVDDRKWEVSTDDVRAGVWQRVDVSWHPEKGLSMFVDDMKVDEVSTSVPVVPTDKTDTHVYVGRTTDMTNKKYFKGIIDELDVWYAPRSHLVANNYFKYADMNVENIDREKYVFTRIEDNKVVNQYDKDIVVYGNPTIGRGRDGPDIVLDGRNDYLDFGENVTCKGDLYECFDGITIRLLMKANSVRDNQYLMSGSNAEMFFENGKLIGKFFHGDQEWRTETADVIEPGKWYLVALSWYAADGAHLHVNCVKSDHANKAVARNEGADRHNRRFYIGRANTQMIRERYADVEVEKFQIWSARRDYMDAYGLLKAECDPTATRGPDVTTGVTPGENPTIQCSGNTVLDFNNARMNYRRNTNELLTIEFKASFKDGLLWFTENDEGKMFVTLQDSKAVVDYDFRLPSGRQYVSITSAAGQLSDGNWHKIEVKKRGREVSVVVDDRYVETKRLEGDFYFASDKRTYLCGTPRTNTLTNYEIDRNYVGYIREATLEGDPSTPVTDYLNLVSKRPLDPYVKTTPDLVITYGDITDQTTNKPPVVITKLPTIAVTPTATFHTDSSVVKINRWDAFRTGTLEFRFKTSDPEGLLFYNGAGFGNRDFVAVEIFDGDLYLVANLGGTTHREKINRRSPVNDGVYHTVKIEHNRKKFMSTVDNHVTEMTIPGQDETLDLNTFLYVGGIEDFNNVNWHVWTRKGFKGCIRDLKVNFVDTELKQFAEHQRVGGVSFGSTCGQPPLDCNNSPCTNGRCVDSWGSHKCHCEGTPYTGDRCEDYASLISFTGDEAVHVNFTRPRKTHTNHFTVRFRSSRPDGLIFTTDSKDNDFISLCLKNGRAQLTVSDLSTVKSVDAGAGLNDNRWHTAWIRRRAEYVEIWIDGQLQHVVDTIPKTEFDIKMENIYYGRYPDNKSRSPYQNCENFIGQLQSATMQNMPIFGRIQQGDDGSGLVVTSSTSTGPRPDFKPVHFVDPGSHVGLRELPRSRDVTLNYMFKTLQHDGLLMFAGRPGNDYFIGMELVDGWLHYLFNNRTTLETVRIGSPRRLNDNAWHRVELKLNTPNGPILSVDDTITRLPDGTKFETNKLNGPLYIGGVPNRMYGTLPALVNSRDGFKGCFSSWVVNRVVLDLLDSNLIRNGFIRDGCNVQVDRCNPNPCRQPGALCISIDNGFFCDCNMTAHVTVKMPEYCGFEAEGFRYGKTGNTGLVTYAYPSYRRPSTSEDRLAIGFMTWMKDGTIFRAEGRNYSGIAGNFIEVRLEDGYVVTEYKYTGGSGIVYDRNMKYNDGEYHVVRFERDNERTRMYVDNFPVGLGASSTGSSGQVGSVIFTDQSYLFAGGRRDAGGTVYSAFDGIIAGVFWNGFRLLDWAMDAPNKGSWAGDVFVAPHLFHLTRPGGTGAVIGGGKGSAGSVLYAAPAAAGASVAVAATTGGIILGILAALLLLATALMWALYKCKPGLLPCGGYAPVKTVPAAPLGAGGKVKFVNGAAAGNGVFVAGGGGGGFAASETTTGSFAAAGAAFTAASTKGAGGGGAATYKTVETETYDGIVLGAGGGGGGGGGGARTTTTTIINESYGGAGGAGFAVAAGGAGAHKRTVATNTLERSAGGGAGGGAGYAAGGGYSESWSEGAGYGAGGYGGGGGGGAITTTTTEVTETLLAGGGGGGGGYGAGYGGAGGGYGESYSASSYNAASGYGGGGGGAGGYGTGGASAYGGGYGGGGAGYGSTSSYGGTLNRETFSPPPITNPQVVSIAPEVRVESFVITANGRYVITGSSMGPPQVWDSKTGDLIRSMAGDRLGSTDVHLACAESILAGLVTVEKIVDASTIKRNRQLDMRLQLWGFESGQPLDMPSTIHATATVLMHDRDRLILGRTERHGSGVSVLMWDLGGNQMVNQYRYSAPAGSCDIVTHVDVTNDDKFAVAGFKHLFTGSTNFAVFDLNNPRGGPVVYSVDCETDCLCLLDHHEAVVGTNDGEMIVWSLRTGQNLRTWGMAATNSKAPHSDRITALTQSRDYIVAASADTTLTMWDKETGDIQHRLVGHVDEVWCCAVTSTQDLIISGSRDNTIRLWRCKDGSEVSSFNALMDIFSLKVSVDKRVIVALGDRDHSRKLIMLQVLHSRQPKRHQRNASDVMV